MFITLSVIGFASTMIGNWGVNRKKRWAFVMWSIGNVMWISTVLMCSPVNWIQILTLICYAGFNIEGWIKWRDK